MDTEYKCIIKNNPESGYDGYVEDIGVFVIGKNSIEEVKESIRKGVELHILSLYPKNIVPKKWYISFSEEVV
jgi:predicted RNase H-like HicB family nuclease